jgi:hypothetical protein
MDFSRFIEHFQNNYYSELLMFIVELVALIISLLFVRNDKIGRLFIFYIAFDFCILLINFYFEFGLSISKKNYFYFLNTANTLVAYVELVVYYYFFKKVLQGYKIKKILTSLILIYSLLLIIFITTKFSFITIRYNYIAYMMGATEFVFLIVPCVFYYLQLFKTNSPFSLFERSSFWIVTGIFFYCFISVPFYVICLYLVKVNPELNGILGAAFFYIPFIVNILFLIKAFLCKKPLTI